MTDVVHGGEPTADALDLPKVERVLVASGRQHDVECAVRADLTSPSAQFLEELQLGRLEDNSFEDLLEADEQISFYNWLLEALTHLAEEGSLPGYAGYNALDEGIWEIKRWDVRITFFDTPGAGTQEPKRIERDFVTGRPHWPWFDLFIRLTTAFHKDTQRTREEQLELAETVMKEDLAHDA